MKFTRRGIIKAGVIATAGTGLYPRSLRAMSNDSFDSDFSIQDSQLRNLVETALDAARSAGASYADVRLTFTDSLSAGQRTPSRSQSMTIGVRALVDGYWGFAASPVWSIDEASRLGQSAVAQGKANVLGSARAAELAPISQDAARTGHWSTPVTQDPFKIDYDEIYDYIMGLHEYMSRLTDSQYTMRSRQVGCLFVRQDKAFGSTEDQYFTQSLFRIHGGVKFLLESRRDKRGQPVNLHQLSSAGKGFEYYRDRPIRDYIDQGYEEAKEILSLPVKPIDVGRFNVLIDSPGVASLIANTIGVATELDRALGYEANATGTSYINEPFDMIGNFRIGSDLMNISGNRSKPGASGTVQWDDEGVVPQNFELVRNGILVDMQTNREGAGWMKSIYEKSGRPFVSHGCAYAPDSIYAPMIHSANLTLQPGDNTIKNLSQLREKMGEGIEFLRPVFNMDFQQATGMAAGTPLEIKNGKRVAVYTDAGIIFRTPEIWGGITELGGPESAEDFGFGNTKGQPPQSGFNNIRSVPLIAKELTVIDIKRKA